MRSIAIVLLLICLALAAGLSFVPHAGAEPPAPASAGVATTPPV